MARLYTVYLRTAAAYDPDRLTLVKDGFSWPAFLLAVPWALWHRMWLAAAALAALQLVIGGLAGLSGFGETVQGVLLLGLAVATGYAAVDLRDGSLRRKGHAAVDIVIAENRDMAVRRFLENRPRLAATMAAAGGD